MHALHQDCRTGDDRRRAAGAAEVGRVGPLGGLGLEVGLGLARGPGLEVGVQVSVAGGDDPVAVGETVDAAAVVRADADPAGQPIVRQRGARRRHHQGARFTEVGMSPVQHPPALVVDIAIQVGVAVAGGLDDDDAVRHRQPDGVEIQRVDLGGHVAALHLQQQDIAGLHPRDQMADGVRHVAGGILPLVVMGREQDPAGIPGDSPDTDVLVVVAAEDLPHHCRAVVAAILALAVAIAAEGQVLLRHEGRPGTDVHVVDPTLLQIGEGDPTLFETLGLVPCPERVDPRWRTLEVLLGGGIGVLGIGRRGVRGGELAIGEIDLGQLVELPHQAPDRPLVGRLPAVAPGLAGVR